MHSFCSSHWTFKRKAVRAHTSILAGAVAGTYTSALSVVLGRWPKVPLTNFQSNSKTIGKARDHWKDKNPEILPLSRGTTTGFTIVLTVPKNLRLILMPLILVTLSLPTTILIGPINIMLLLYSNCCLLSDTSDTVLVYWITSHRQWPQERGHSHHYYRLSR